MYHSKKFFSLVTTCIVGFSTVVSIIPVSALADTSKTGNTVLTYDGTPQPKEWGLSIPSTVNLDKQTSVETDYGEITVVYNNLKVAIVNEDGTSFKDIQKTHKFFISGTGTGKDGSLELLDSANKKLELYTTPASAVVQDNHEPTSLNIQKDWATMTTNIPKISLTTDTNSQNGKPVCSWIQFAFNKAKAPTNEVHETISWTATMS